MPRIVHLRRPPTLRVIDEPFVPRGIDLDDAERRWRALCRANPAYFDGRLLHVFGVSRNGHGGATIHVAECAYRWHAVNGPDFDTGARPIGVKGIVLAEGYVLVGRRSRHVSAYGGCWEFAPGGGVTPGVEPAEQLRRELQEETGIGRDATAAVSTDVPAPIARAIFFDEAVRTWEIVYLLRLARRAACTPASAEYDVLRWIELESVVSGTAPDVRDAPDPSEMRFEARSGTRPAAFPLGSLTTHVVPWTPAAALMRSLLPASSGTHHRSLEVRTSDSGRE